MSAPSSDTLSKYEVARDQIVGIDNLLQQFYDAGGSTGIFSGNFEKTLNKLGTVSDPELVGIATQIASALQIYRNAVSGTAYSVQEGKDIASIFPGINKSEGLNNAIIKGRLGAFDTTIDSMYRNVLGSGYDSIKPKKGETQTPPSGEGEMTLEDQFKLYQGGGTDTPVDTPATTTQSTYKSPMSSLNYTQPEVPTFNFSSFFK
jgi:hypothetical protein